MIKRLSILIVLMLTVVTTGLAVKSVNIFTRSVPAGQNAVAYTTTVKAKFGTKPYTWSIGSGTLPTGLSIAGATGIISGTPTVNNTFNFVVHVVDSAGSPTSDDQSLFIVVSGSAPAPTPSVSVTTGSLPAGVVGGAYSATLQASGGTAPYTWSIPASCIVPNCALPPAAVLTGATGAITGTLTVPGTYSVIVRVTDSSPTSQIADRAFAVTVAAGGTYLRQFDFESGNLAGWDYVRNPTRQTVQGVIKHGGSYAEQIHYILCGDSTDPACGASHEDDNAYTNEEIDESELYLRGYLYMKSPEPGGTKDGVNRKIYWLASSHDEWSAILTTVNTSGTNSFRFVMNPSTPCAVPASSFTFGTTTLWDGWHIPELRTKLNTPGVSDGIVSLWIDGVQLGSTSSNRNIRGTCTSNIGYFSVGRQADRFNYNVVDEYRYWDDIIANTSYIGP